MAWFTRRRPRQGRGGGMDESSLQRALAALPVDAASAQRRTLPGVADSFALIASASATEGGAGWAVAVGQSGADALLAALAAAAAEPQPPAMLAACAPHWDGASRWLLSRLSQRTGPGGAPEIWPLCLPAGQSGEGGEGGEPGAVLAQAESAPPAALPPERLAESLQRQSARELFRRAALALAGLAAKYEGAIRSAPPASGAPDAPGGAAALELVLLAQPVASLRAGAGGEVLLEVAGRDISLRGDALAEALDRLEVQLRQRARRAGRGDRDGARPRLLAALCEAARLRHLCRWPMGGDGAALDGLAVRPGGEIALLAARARLGLPELAAILRAAWAVGPSLPLLLRQAPAPLRLDSPPALLLAAPVFEDAARAALQWLSPVALWQAGNLDGALQPLPLPGAVRSAADTAESAAAEPGAPRRRRSRGRGRRRGAAPDAADASSEAGAESAAQPADGPGAADGHGPGAADGPAQAAGFDEVSLFDLDTDSGGESRPTRRRRSGRRGRSGDSPSGDAGADSGARASAGAEPRGERERERGRARSARQRGRGGRGRSGASAAESAESRAPADSGEVQAAEEESLDEVMQLSPDAPEFPEPGDYERLATLGDAADSEDADSADAADGAAEDAAAESEIERLRRERAQRRRAQAEAGGGLPEDAADEAPGAASQLPRGRVAILAHADRQSIIAAVLLAREMRQIEGIWVYPQSELMTFFRSAATDLPGRAPIYVVGFAAKPAGEVLQSAALYQGRLAWFDHHEWPPEDLEAMRQAIGAPLAHLHPGAHSSLPAALAFCTWRSRLSSKLVDLVTGAFTAHDFEKWGRLWWWRLGEMTQPPGGPRHKELQLLISGRPSELTGDAERHPAPPLPEEAAWAAQRDFRLLHFGGLRMVVADVPAGLDLHMAMRIARAPHGARISLARNAAEETFVLASDEAAGQRRLDTAAMALHLSQKFTWLEALPDADRVTRFRIRGVAEQPMRLEGVIAEIGMGRAILEG